MSLITMAAELRGAVPNIAMDYCKTLVNRAWLDTRRRNLWSFQLYDGPNWISPDLVDDGTVTTVQGVNTVTFDATALAAINASETNYSAITQRQFRVSSGGSPWGTIYNIYAWDSVTGVATLDRPYGESGDSDLSYSLYQVYYAAPYADHVRFISVRDMTNFNDLILTQTRELIDFQDPQRTRWAFPTHVVYYAQDQNPDSDTLGYALYELWGAPTYNLVWQLYGIRNGAELEANNDTLPWPVSEATVLSQARYYAYEWAMANMGALPRNQGPDWKFLMSQASDQFDYWLKFDRTRDREAVNNWFSIRRSALSSGGAPYYSTYSNTAAPGGPGW